VGKHPRLRPDMEVWAGNPEPELPDQGRREKNSHNSKSSRSYDLSVFQLITMPLFPKLHDLYIARTVLLALVMVWAVLVGLDAILAVVDEIDQIGLGRYDFLGVLTYVAWSLPRRMYMMFPTAAVIGALMGLGQLAASSELTVMRAVGLSRKRIGLSVVAPLLILTGLMVVNAETLAPWAQHNGDTMRMQARTQNMLIAQYFGLWAREGNTILNAQVGQEHQEEGARWLELNNVRLFEFAEDGRLDAVVHAAQAEHRSGEWRLHDVKRTHFHERSLSQSESVEEQWDSALDAAALAASARVFWRPRYMSSRDLRHGIDYRERNELDASEYLEYYWAHWFYPLNVMALCLAALPFAFGSLRSGNLGRRLFVGVVFALGFWLLQNQVVKLAAVYKFDYRLAYLIPPLVMLTLSWQMFRRRR